MELTQKQVLSQQMLQSMEILQMSAQELESYLENLALENPVMDLSDSRSSDSDSCSVDIQRKMDWLASTDLQNKVYYQQERAAENIEQNWHNTYDLETDLREFLLSQLILEDYTAKERAIAEFIIDSLDSRGYFQDEVSAVAAYCSVDEELAEKILEDIQSLDPAGVGARDLRECLLLQLKRKPDASQTAFALVRNHLDELAKNHFPAVAKKLQISLEELNAAYQEIQALNPRPGNSFSDREQLRYISPDVLVVKLENEFRILINEYQYPDFTINSYYQELMKKTDDMETKKYLQTKVSQAKWVQSCIAQRNTTLSRTVHALVQKQQEFFLFGSGFKRPMKLADLAQELGVHESTVSRVLRGKYLQCSFGIFPLSYFLTSVAARKSGGRKDSQEVTSEQIKAYIQAIIDQEDSEKPLSDQQISEALEKRHIQISRRTVNKYRTEMGLPDKEGRRQWK